MIINNDIVFLHLQKCGGTFIKHMMEDHMGARNHRPEHNGYRDISGTNKKKLIMGSIRNPYSWYTSLYFNHYQDPRSFFKSTFQGAPSFADWVKRLLAIDRGRMHDMRFSQMARWDVGPYTFRTLKCYASAEPLDMPLTPDIVMLGNIEIIKTDNLAQNFVDVVEGKVGINPDVKEKILTAKRIHTSDHGHYSEYYDREAYDLVSHKDRLIFDIFDYERE